MGGWMKVNPRKRSRLRRVEFVMAVFCRRTTPQQLSCRTVRVPFPLLLDLFPSPFPFPMSQSQFLLYTPNSQCPTQNIVADVPLLPNPKCPRQQLRWHSLHSLSPIRGGLDKPFSEREEAQSQNSAGTVRLLFPVVCALKS